jgi:hypothetical protein
VLEHVGQRLLGHAVDDELGLRREVGQARLDVDGDLQARVLGHALAQHVQGAGQPEVVERLGTQHAGDAADLLEAAARGLLGLQDLRAGRVGRVLGGAAELEHHAGERLPDAVVELLGHPQALALLGLQRPPHALAALGLQAVEHLVERRGQLGGLARAAPDGQARSGVERVDRAREGGELAQRGERRPQQQQVDGDDHRQAAEEDRELAHGDVVARAVGQRGDHAGGGEHSRVAGGHAPEQRGPQPWAGDHAPGSCKRDTTQECGSGTTGTQAEACSRGSGHVHAAVVGASVPVGPTSMSHDQA